MIKIMATTINNSISENPVCFLFSVLPVILASGKVKHTSQVGNHSRTNYTARFLSCNLLILKILVLLWPRSSRFLAAHRPCQRQLLPAACDINCLLLASLLETSSGRLGFV